MKKSWHAFVVCSGETDCKKRKYFMSDFFALKTSSRRSRFEGSAGSEGSLFSREIRESRNMGFPLASAVKESVAGIIKPFTGSAKLQL